MGLPPPRVAEYIERELLFGQKVSLRTSPESKLRLIQLSLALVSTDGRVWASEKIAVMGEQK